MNSTVHAGGTSIDRHRGWSIFAFRLGLLACALFVVLTAIAMLIYPGGSISNPDSEGYSFFDNFFSELGRTVTRSNRPNLPSVVLFAISLTLVGSAFMLVFASWPPAFRPARVPTALSLIGSACGVGCGLCFIGVGLTPADLLFDLHRTFMMNAFRLFLLASIFYCLAIFFHGRYPKKYALVFSGFAVLLLGYLALLSYGPDRETPAGARVQATGQKCIAYAAVACMAIQCAGALRYTRTTWNPGNPESRESEAERRSERREGDAVKGQELGTSRTTPDL